MGAPYVAPDATLAQNISNFIVVVRALATLDFAFLVRLDATDVHEVRALIKDSNLCQVVL